jgi:hypothetical protein
MDSSGFPVSTPASACVSEMTMTVITVTMLPMMLLRAKMYEVRERPS